MGVKKFGSDELIADLRELAQRSPEAARRALLRGAKEAVETAKANTPVRTGRARRSIHVAGHPELSGDFSPGGDSRWYGDLGKYQDAAGKETLAVELGSDLWYFVFIEDGGRRNPARRPIGRAVDDIEPRMETYVLEEMDALAREVDLV